jgi:DNA-binding PadR family transcriptional regulator
MTDKRRTSSGHPRIEGLKGLSGADLKDSIKDGANVSWFDVLQFMKRADRPVTTDEILAAFTRKGMVNRQDAYIRLERLVHWAYARISGRKVNPGTGRKVKAYQITDYGKRRVAEGRK